MTNKRESIVLNSAMQKIEKDATGINLNMEEAVSLYKNAVNMLPDSLTSWVQSWLYDRYEGTETYGGGVRYSRFNSGRKVSKRNSRNL
jgi:hypothetical protein